MKTTTYGTARQTELIERLDRRDRMARTEPSLISDAVKVLGLQATPYYVGEVAIAWEYSVNDTARLLDYLLS